MQTPELSQKLQITDGSFSPNEVRDLVLKPINDQINFYKLKNLSNWIHDHNTNQDFCEEKIAQLKARKQELTEMINEAKMLGCNMKLKESFEISFDSDDRNN